VAGAYRAYLANSKLCKYSRQCYNCLSTAPMLTTFTKLCISVPPPHFSHPTHPDSTILSLILVQPNPICLPMIPIVPNPPTALNTTQTATVHLPPLPIKGCNIQQILFREALRDLRLLGRHALSGFRGQARYLSPLGGRKEGWRLVVCINVLWLVLRRQA